MHLSARSPRLSAALAAAAALCVALPALAAQVTDVRVGVHPKYTRIVFELDGRAGYKVEHAGTDAAPELRITIEATSSARELRANGEIRGVKVDAGTKARAHITLRQPGLRVHEMMLSDPPRIVIDLHKPETAVAATAKPAPKPKAAAKETPAPAPAPKVAAKEAPAPPAPAPKVAAKETPKPDPAPKVVPAPPPAAEATKTAIAPPSPAPAPKEVAPIPSGSPAEDSALKPAPRVTPPPGEIAQAAKPAAPPAPEAPKTAAAPPTPVPTPGPTPSAAAPPTPDSVAQLPPAPIPPTPPAAKSPSPVRPTPTPAPITPAPPAAASEGWNPIWIGGIIAAALLGLGAIVLVLRRRRALPNDLDVTAIAEEVELMSDAPGRIPSGGFAMGDDSASSPAGQRAEETTLAGLFDRPAAPAPVWPAPPPSAKPAPTPAPAAAVAEDSLFDDAGEMAGEPDASEGDAPMNQEMDLPVDRRLSPPAARMGGSAAPASPDVARMLQDFERRIATVEARLDESNEAREKLERQVAAQSEELRVQRAAIARTQRALRTMTRGEEDKATEPALRDGDTQAKTRVTP